jgi:hypothetical protein
VLTLLLGLRKNINGIVKARNDLNTRHNGFIHLKELAHFSI